MKVFCDTNVLVAAFVSRGFCADLVRAILAYEELVTGEVVLAELVRVLREKLHAREELVHLSIDLLRQQTVVPRPAKSWPGPVADPDDAWILASALGGHAEVLVTGDVDLLGLEPVPGIEILKPRDLWDMLVARYGLKSGAGDNEDGRYPPPVSTDDDAVMEPARVSWRSHEELEVYRLAFEAAGKIFELSKSFPTEERYSLTDQIRRSSRSVCANLAEAWRKRRYRAAFQAKLNDAESEAAETQTWLRFAGDCSYLDAATADRLCARYDQVIGKLVTIINNPDPWLIPNT